MTPGAEPRPESKNRVMGNQSRDQKAKRIAYLRRTAPAGYQPNARPANLRTGLHAPKARVKLRHSQAIDQRTAAARAALGWRRDFRAIPVSGLTFGRPSEAGRPLIAGTARTAPARAT